MRTTNSKANEIADFVLKDKAYLKYGYRSHWISGSSTIVYPVSIDLIGVFPKITVQWGKYNGNTFKAFCRRLVKAFPDFLEEITYNKNLGCPDTIEIYLI